MDVSHRYSYGRISSFMVTFIFMECVILRQQALKTTNCNCCDILVLFEGVIPIENNPPLFCRVCQGVYCGGCWEDHISDEWWINNKVVAS